MKIVSRARRNKKNLTKLWSRSLNLLGQRSLSSAKTSRKCQLKKINFESKLKRFKTKIAKRRLSSKLNSQSLRLKSRKRKSQRKMKGKKERKPKKRGKKLSSKPKRKRSAGREPRERPVRKGEDSLTNSLTTMASAYGMISHLK